MKNRLIHKTSALFLSHYFWPEEMATSEMLSGIAFSLSRIGISVSGLAGHPAYRGNMERLPSNVEHGGVHIRRVWSTQFDKNNVLGRVLNTSTFTISSLISCLFITRPNVMISVTNPPLLPWVSWVMHTIRGIPYVLIIHDVYPDVAVALNRIPKNSIIEKTWKFLNRLSYTKATRIVVLGECMADVLRKELSFEQHSKVVVIPNWADGQMIQPMQRKDHPLLKEWGVANKFVIQYSGNIGLFHEIETIINAAEQLKHINDIHFVFIGDGGQLPWLNRQVKERELDNVTLMPFQPKERLPLTLTACDAALVTLKDEVTGLCIPSKLYGVLAAGKPVLCVANPASESSQMVKLHSCGITVLPGDSKSLAEAIRCLKETNEDCQRYGKAARNAYENNYTLDIIASKYADMLNEAFK